MKLNTDFVYEPWRNSGLCVGMEGLTFFPASYDTTEILRVKSLCEQCPVAKECLEFALASRQTEGIWGGKTPKERMQIRRRRSRKRRRESRLNQH